MNYKFYALPVEKQSQILNAAYKVFAMNQYKKAPTSEIAAEAGISKSLLFHYFHNKQELYLFLWNHAADLTKKYMCKYKVYETDDFFEMMRRGLMAKCSGCGKLHEMTGMQFKNIRDRSNGKLYCRKCGDWMPVHPCTHPKEGGDGNG